MRLPAFRVENGVIQRLASWSGVIAESPADHQRVTRDWPEHSELSSGHWIKFATTLEGIHKIEYSDLVASGLDPDTLDFAKIHLYGGVADNCHLKMTRKAP